MKILISSKILFLHIISDDQVSAKTIKISRMKVENRIVIEFADNGTRIPAKLLEKILEPNYSTIEGGSGIGLTRIRKIINMHEGSITCNCNDKMAKFVIEF